MAGEWIKMRHRLLGEQEVKAMALRLRVSRQHIAGCLLAVWSHADQFAVERPDTLQRDNCPPDTGTKSGTEVEITEGFLAFTSLADIDHEAMQPGFAEAMEAVGWLRVYEDGVGFPQYQIHHSSSSKTRASEAKKKQTQRAKKEKSPAKRPDATGTDVPASAGQKPDTIEGEREEEGEIQNKNQNKNQKGEVAERTGGAASGGEARTRSRPATPASRSEKISEGGAGGVAGGELTAEAEDVLGAWDGIGGVSHEHATPAAGGDTLVYDRRVLELLKARLRDAHFREHWRTGLNFVRSSRLCRGMVEPREGFDVPWRATLKWFCSPGNLAKVLEGSHGGNAEGLTEEDDDQFFAEQRERALALEAAQGSAGGAA